MFNKSTNRKHDIRDPQVWTLKSLYLHLQAKQDSMHLKDCSIQFVIQDSTGKIKDSYPAHLATLSFHPKYQTTLGFISGDTLYAGYDYSYRELIQATIGQIPYNLYDHRSTYYLHHQPLPNDS